MHGKTPSAFSVLGKIPALDMLLFGICCAWLAISAVALITKLVRWNSYQATWAKRPQVVRASRIGSYVAWAAAILLFIDRAILGFCALVSEATAATSNPQTFLGGAAYMVSQSLPMYAQGITTTISLAVFGTIIAFFFAVVLVFLRIQEPDRSDNDFVRFLKKVGSGFAFLYSTIIRGTPMMVQGLIIYSGGFMIFRNMGYSVSETRQIWSYFVAGLVIVTVNSTAYIMEALRGGIEAVDPGQAEAARSLGLSQWMAMMHVVFPQGVRNAIPALSNEMIMNIKDSSVLSVVGVFDLMFATTTVAGIYYRQMELYVVAALIYLIITFIATRLLNMLSKKLGAQEVSELPANPTE
jgi:putative lysine transport system permease protein